jgi:hypothetical protein
VIMTQTQKRKFSHYRTQLAKWKSKSVPNNSNWPDELENLHVQVHQIKDHVDLLSNIIVLFDSRAFTGLNILGIILYYVFAPFRRIKRLLGKRFLWKRFLWGWFYWICFMWVYVQDVGIKEVLFHPRRDFPSIDSRNS